MLLRREVDEERNEHIDMTPMVDVVFQLMTFMLFSIQMSGGEKVDVPPARHGVGVEESDATFLTLLKPSKPGGEARLLIGHGEGPLGTLDQARQAVVDGVKRGPAQGHPPGRRRRPARRSAQGRQARSPRSRGLPSMSASRS